MFSDKLANRRLLYILLSALLLSASIYMQTAPAQGRELTAETTAAEAATTYWTGTDAEGSAEPEQDHTAVSESGIYESESAGTAAADESAAAAVQETEETAAQSYEDQINRSIIMCTLCHIGAAVFWWLLTFRLKRTGSPVGLELECAAMCAAVYGLRFIMAYKYPRGWIIPACLALVIGSSGLAGAVMGSLPDGWTLIGRASRSILERGRFKAGAIILPTVTAILAGLLGVWGAVRTALYYSRDVYFMGIRYDIFLLTLIVCWAAFIVLYSLKILRGSIRLSAEEEQAAIESARVSERFRVDLIANVSHDLRTPLTSILGYSELLQSEELSEKGSEELSRLNEKSRYMKDLVDSLFELTKVSSGVIEHRSDELDLIRLLEQTVGFYDEALKERGLTVRRHYCSGSCMIISDGTFLNQIFSNLMNNAIKYSLEGTRIHIYVTEGDRVYTVKMQNIASYEMDFDEEEIMERFARGDRARTSEGSGLGLAIARTYAEALGGTFGISVAGDQFTAEAVIPIQEETGE